MNAAAPTTPIKLTNGYHVTQVLPSGQPAELTPSAYPATLPASLGAAKPVGSISTFKVAALDAPDPGRTFKAAGGVEQAVLAASLLARRGPAAGIGSTASWAVLAADDELYVTPLWYKNPVSSGQRSGVDVDYASTQAGDANAGRGMASRASTPIYVAAVGADRWIDLR